MTPHDTDLSELLRTLSTDPASGLTDADAAARLARDGENRLREKKKKSMFLRFLDQFKDVMILILLAAAVVSFVVACSSGEASEFFEPILIVAIVIANAVMGVLQESKAEKALDALKNLSAPHARVLRDGKESVVEAKDLVTGDVILLEAGDFVPADARLLTAASLKCEESALTGESVPAEKDAQAAVASDAPLGDRRNMVYSGCSVTYGRATAVVTATGMNTEMGKIANLLDSSEDTQTPLQKKLANLGKYLGILALAACAVVFVVGLLNGMEVMDIFMTAVSLAVSAIPEGLPAIVTIVLAIGVQRMVKRNAIIRRLPAVETLGSASVICSDKTGTLTQNRMTLTHAYADGAAAPEAISSDNSESVRRLLRLAALCCDGSVTFTGDTEQHIGDPTETAILVAAHKNGMDKDDLNAQSPRIAELPFDSDRKLMTTVNRIDGQNIVIVKGAFDVLASRCVSGDLESARRVCDEMSDQALRVLAVAAKRIDALPDAPTSDVLERDLTMLGLVGMIDPPRPEAREAVKQCRRAGIKPVMITGDHVVTASAIARDLGILQPGDEAVTGAQLQKMTDSELDSRVRSISVYARVSPEDKIRIVRAWQRQGEIVSMTGDGINDAPALKAADIGCAMGITGTDVAKGAADMTLTDDNFSTIVSAVREGRGIYDNIKKAVGFLLGTNIGEILTVFLAMVCWHKSPMLSMQLLWINLVTDSLPAIAIGMEAVEPDVMERKPKPRDESIFAHGMGVRIALQGLLFSGLTLFAFHLGESTTGSLAGGQTLAFMVLALSQIFHAFNMRTNQSLFKVGVFSNPQMNKAALVSLALTAAVLFIPPLATVFGLIQLPGWLYLAGLGLSLVSIPVVEITKALGLHKA